MHTSPMDHKIFALLDKVWTAFKKIPPDLRILIAIGGIPGSGKTALAHNLTKQINELHASMNPSSPDAVAIHVPMDGFHLTRAQLALMPDPDEAFARRGAAFTFDADAYVALVQALRAPLVLPPGTPTTAPIYADSVIDAIASPPDDPQATILAPSFDHAVKDPRPNDIVIRPRHRIILLEGNYVCLDVPPWRDAAALMDERWLVDVDAETARKRLIRRHINASIAKNEAQADQRVRENDLPNGAYVLANKVQIDEVIVSQEDKTWMNK